MTYKVLLTPHAAREYKKLPADVKSLIQRGIDALCRHPLAGPKIKRLKGRLREYFRLRVGDYRVVYSVDKSNHIVYIDYIQHRRDIYQNIE